MNKIVDEKITHFLPDIPLGHPFIVLRGKDRGERFIANQSCNDWVTVEGSNRVFRKASVWSVPYADLFHKLKMLEMVSAKQHQKNMKDVRRLENDLEKKKLKEAIEKAKEGLSCLKDSNFELADKYLKEVEAIVW